MAGSKTNVKKLELYIAKVEQEKKVKPKKVCKP